VLATGRTRGGVLRDRAIGFAVVLLAISLGLGIGLTVSIMAGGEPNASGSFLTAVASGVCVYVAYALGVAVSQLIGTARSAAGVGALIVTVLYLLTNVWDRIGVLGAVRFISPFYYFDESRALVPGHSFSIPAALVSVVLAGALLALAAWAFQRRDVGAPLLARRPRRTASVTRVQQPALRALWSAMLMRDRSSLVAWCLSAAAWMGLTAWLTPSVIDVWDKFGFTRNVMAIDPSFSAADHYLSFAAEILAPIVAAFVITRAASWVADLQSGRVEITLSTPLSWAGLVGQRLIVLLVEVAVVVIGGMAGLRCARRRGGRLRPGRGAAGGRDLPARGVPRCARRRLGRLASNWFGRDRAGHPRRSFLPVRAPGPALRLAGLAGADVPLRRDWPPLPADTTRRGDRLPGCDGRRRHRRGRCGGPAVTEGPVIVSSAARLR